jgi:acetyl-CoA synthetase
MKTIQSMEQYKNSYNQSLHFPNDFYEQLASEFSWKQKWSEILSGDFDTILKENKPLKWFSQGKLNITENCLDRHLELNADKEAIIFEPNDPNEKNKIYTYKDLHALVCQFSNVLKEKGVKKGDRVCFYMGMVPELLAGVLASARIGAIHSVIFAGFSSDALLQRINDSEAKIVLTCDGAYRGNKIIALKKIVDDAILHCPKVKTVLVLKRTNSPIQLKQDRDFILNELIDNSSTHFVPEIMDSEDPLFILYTSGSTGKPKGLLHTCAGYMVWSAYTFANVFQTQENDVFWCTADIGWITGHSYIAYGPLLNGRTQVMFEGIPTYPDAGRFWDVVDKHHVTHFYTAPTAIRALEAFGPEHVENKNLNSLKVLGTVGEPINEEAWSWYFTNIGKGKCPIVDTWWQTETGGIMISNLANITPHKPTFATIPLPGVKTVLLDADSNEIQENNAEGALCIKRPWPGIARTIWGDFNRYKETYFSQFPGYYCTGDGAKRDFDGHYRITGRIDDLINVSGHLLSTAEVEDKLNEHASIVESAVVGYPHKIKGQAIYAFIISPQPNFYKENKLLINKQLTDHISKTLGPICKPEHIQLVPGLPKTRSGKIMRRILRNIAAGDTANLGDTSTLVNPEIVDKILSHMKNT